MTRISVVFTTSTSINNEAARIQKSVSCALFDVVLSSHWHNPGWSAERCCTFSGVADACWWTDTNQSHNFDGAVQIRQTIRRGHSVAWQVEWMVPTHCDSWIISRRPTWRIKWKGFDAFKRKNDSGFTHHWRIDVDVATVQADRHHFLCSPCARWCNLESFHRSDWWSGFSWSPEAHLTHEWDLMIPKGCKSSHGRP